MSYGLDDLGILVRFPAGKINVFLELATGWTT